MQRLRETAGKLLAADREPVLPDRQMTKAATELEVKMVHSAQFHSESGAHVRGAR